MITHIVMFKLKDRSDESINKAVDKIRALMGQVPSLRGLEVGKDVIKSARSFDLVLIARFEDIAGLEAYQVHPAHVPVLDYMRGVAESATAVDFES